MRTELDDNRLEAWRTFLKTHAAVIDLIEREMVAAKRLPLNKYDVLVALAGAPDHRLRMHELANAIVLSRSGLTRLVDRLEAEGMLYRESCSDDRRGCYAVLTPKGLDALRDSWPVYARGIGEHFGRYLSDEDARAMTRALSRVLSAARGTEVDTHGGSENAPPTNRQEIAVS